MLGLPRSALAGTAVAVVAGLLVSTPLPPAAAFDPRGIARMQACTPPTADFVSLEAAPEVVGPIPLGAGMHRLWDLGVGWTHVNPAPGTFDWSVLDAEVAQVEESGSRPMLVLGLTPQWAAANPSAGDPRWGLGTASPPRDMGDWTRYVAAVVDRYGSRIAAYEVWNEANLQTFWTGSPEQMADLTAQAYAVIKARQPEALVLAPSTTTRLRPSMRNYTRRFLAAMRDRGFPFDAFAIHTYPAGDQGPPERAGDITYWQGIVVEALGPDSPILDKPIFDTEVNYGLAGPGTRPGRSYSDAEGAALLAQTLLDSQRLGIDATFWYMYTAAPYSLLGVQLWEGTPITRAYWEASRRVFAPGTPCPAAGAPNPYDTDLRLAAVPAAVAPGRATVDGTEAAATVSGGRLTVAGPGALTVDTGSANSRWPYSAYQDRTLNWTATGLAPASRVYAWEATTGTFLGAITATADGTGSGTVVLPADVPPGDRVLQVTGFAPGDAVRRTSVGIRLLAEATSPARATVRFRPGTARLEAGARDRLADLAGSLPQGASPATVVTVRVPADGATAADRRLARERGQVLAEALRRAGIAGSVRRVLAEALTRREVDRAGIEVSFTRSADSASRAPGASALASTP